MAKTINVSQLVDTSALKDYSFISWDKREVKIHTKGKQILFFISLHCLHCIDFLPDISSIEQEFQEVNFILFSTGDAEDHQEMADYFKWELPIVHLDQDDIERLFNISMLPHMLMLEDGVIKLAGVVDNKTDFLQFAGKLLRN
ncbi:hypothetical protein AZ66_28750 [Paenibacillus sp. E194]|uniref:redoxin domain-containing protein n=1 Tax=Paenibacillus sp. E194 TaxID=1458845 RepID=UPI0005DBAACA|nr:redoxin domain-containing protein [Paenibacillus sp. E194]KJB84793.1 hypothetical protein AZ66_28750 [Paenibacillus sp. E194]